MERPLMKCELLRLGFDLDDFLTVVVAAELANAMAQLHLSAAGALDDAGHGQLPVRAAARIAAGLGHLSLGSGHSYTSSLLSTIIERNAAKGFISSSPC